MAGTPVGDYQESLIYDHRKILHRYGCGHRECLAHVLRCLKGSMEDEPKRKWNLAGSVNP